MEKTPEQNRIPIPSQEISEPPVENEHVIELMDHIRLDLTQTDTIQTFAYYADSLKSMGMLITEAEYRNAAQTQFEKVLTTEANMTKALNIIEVAQFTDPEDFGEWKTQFKKAFLEAIDATGTHMARITNEYQPLEVEETFAIRDFFRENIEDAEFARVLAARAMRDMSEIADLQDKQAVEMIPGPNNIPMGEIIDTITRIDGVDRDEKAALFTSLGQTALRNLKEKISENKALQDMFIDELIRAKNLRSNTQHVAPKAISDQEDIAQ